MPIVKWLAHSAFNPAVWVRFPAGDLLNESVMVTLSLTFYASPHVGHARRSSPVLNYKIIVSGILDQNLLFLSLLENICSCFKEVKISLFVRRELHFYMTMLDLLTKNYSVMMMPFITCLLNWRISRKLWLKKHALGLINNLHKFVMISNTALCDL